MQSSVSWEGTTENDDSMEVDLWYLFLM
jgi:hypothetical protein